MTAIYQAFLNLAERMTGSLITGQVAKDMLWIVAALFGFWLLILIALTPYFLLRWMFNRQ